VVLLRPRRFASRIASRPSAGGTKQSYEPEPVNCFSSSLLTFFPFQQFVVQRLFESANRTENSDKTDAQMTPKPISRRLGGIE